MQREDAVVIPSEIEVCPGATQRKFAGSFDSVSLYLDVSDYVAVAGVLFRRALRRFAALR